MALLCQSPTRDNIRPDGQRHIKLGLVIGANHLGRFFGPASDGIPIAGVIDAGVLAVN